MPTMNQNNHLNESGLVKSLGSQDAESIPNNNKHGAYEIMKNKWGREVPVALELIQEKLKAGFIRTDGITHLDNPDDRVRTPVIEADPARAMAKLAESMDNSIKEIAKRRTKKKVSKDGKKEV